MLQITSHQMEILAAAHLQRNKARLYSVVCAHRSLAIADFDILFQRGRQIGFNDFDALLDVLTAASLTQPKHLEFFDCEEISCELQSTRLFPELIRAKRILNMVQGDG